MVDNPERGIIRNIQSLEAVISKVGTEKTDEKQDGFGLTGPMKEEGNTITALMLTLIPNILVFGKEATLNKADTGGIIFWIIIGVFVTIALLYNVAISISKFIKKTWKKIAIGKFEILLKSGNKVQAYQYYLLMYNSDDEDLVKLSIEYFGKLGDKRAIEELVKNTGYFELKRAPLDRLDTSDEVLFEFYEKALRNNKDSVGDLANLGRIAEFRERTITLLVENSTFFDEKKEALGKDGLNASHEVLFKFYNSSVENGEGNAVKPLIKLAGKLALPALIKYKNILEEKLSHEPTGSDEPSGPMDYSYVGSGGAAYQPTEWVPNPRYEELDNTIKEISDLIAKLEKGEVTLEQPNKITEERAGTRVQPEIKPEQKNKTDGNA
jgi:hypothetical protein